MIAKLVNGNLIQCPRQGTDSSGVLHTNLPLYYVRHLDRAAADGYYPVQHTDKPVGDHQPSWEPQEVEGITMIVQVWTPCTPQPAPMPVPDPYQMRADIDYIAMMGDYDIGG